MLRGEELSLRLSRDAFKHVNRWGFSFLHNPLTVIGEISLFTFFAPLSDEANKIKPLNIERA